MITNADKISDETLGSLVDLNRSQFTFYPCGSRYFGYASKDSDFDFFFEQSAEVKAWLEGIACFTESDKFGYNLDVNTSSIWYCGQTQVMEVKHVDCRLAVQEWITNNGRSPKGDTDWWNAKYCEMFPDLFTMPEKITAADKKAFREEARTQRINKIHET